MKNLFCIILFLTVITASAQSKPDTLKVMSFNILHGATTKGDFNLEAIAGVIKKYNPDLVAMQEVDFKTNRARKYNLPLELGYRTQMMPLYARAMYYDGGEYGEAVLSKYSLIYTESIALPHQADSEPRAAQVARFQTKNGNTIQFVATHLDHLRNETDRLMQADALVDEFKDEKFPTILTGDLNATPESETMKRLYRVFKKPEVKEAYQPTYSSTNPRVCIDHVLFNQPEKWSVLDYEIVCDDYVTDHCIVVVTLVFKP